MIDLMTPLAARVCGSSVVASAPSNIAWIKYMGKKDEANNVPCNSSLSYTVPRFKTTVQITPIGERKDRFSTRSMPLTEKEQSRFFSHADWVKDQCGYTGGLEITSHNNFAKGCGLASSASSFSALTVAVVAITGRDIPYKTVVSWARQGSGSACRSFYGPWVHWSEEEVKPLPQITRRMAHTVLLLSSHDKKVSSSEAHRQVVLSPGYAARMIRAEARLLQLLQILIDGDWFAVYRLVLEESMDMHQLFTHAGFSYWSSATEQALSLVDRQWRQYGNGPIVTMDAGPNIHLFSPEGQVFPGLMAQLSQIGKIV